MERIENYKIIELHPTRYEIIIRKLYGKFLENFEKGIDKCEWIWYNVYVRKTCESLVSNKLENNMLLWWNRQTQETSPLRTLYNKVALKFKVELHIGNFVNGVG